MFRNINLDKAMRNRLFGKGKVDVKDSLSKVKKFNSYNLKLKDIFFKQSSSIPTSLLGERIFVHNGKEILSLKITSSMLGYKCGEFFFNRKGNTSKSVKKK